MKTRLDVILETVSYLLEVNKRGTHGKDYIVRLASIIKRKGGMGTDFADNVMAKLDASDRIRLRSYVSDTRDPERDMRER